MEQWCFLAESRQEVLGSHKTPWSRVFPNIQISEQGLATLALIDDFAHQCRPTLTVRLGDLGSILCWDDFGINQPVRLLWCIKLPILSPICYIGKIIANQFLLSLLIIWVKCWYKQQVLFNILIDFSTIIFDRMALSIFFWLNPSVRIISVIHFIHQFLPIVFIAQGSHELPLLYSQSPFLPTPRTNISHISVYFVGNLQNVGLVLYLIDYM